MKSLLAFILLSLSICTFAGSRETYTQKAFDDAQKAGIPVLIDVYAAWCPTCERQQTILNRYFKNNPGSPIKVLVIDFDKDKQWVTQYKAPRQSTLMIYKNHQQTWFSVAPTSRRVIEEALNLALK